MNPMSDVKPNGSGNATKNPSLVEQLGVADGLVAGATRNVYRPLLMKVSSESALVFPSCPNGLAAEQFRQLRRNLTEQFPEGGALLVTSAAQAEGKTVSATNLAWCLAESGAPTLLFEADLRRPAVAKFLGCSAQVGVESALRGEVEPKAVVAAAENFPLHVATVAKPVRDPSQLIKGVGMRRFLDWARANFRWVVVDAPPVLPAADALELSSLTDAVLLVARVRVTPRGLLEKSCQLLGSRLRGIILNEATLCWDSYHRYLAPYYGPRTK